MMPADGKIGGHINEPNLKPLNYGFKKKKKIQEFSLNKAKLKPNNVYFVFHYSLSH
jgi:hypothetical protein